MKRILKTQTGFTLIELLITITMLAVIASLLSSGFNISLKVWEAGNAKMEEHYSVVQAINLVREEIKSAKKVLTVDPESLISKVAFNGKSNTVAFVTSTPRLATGGNAGGLFIQRITFEAESKKLYFEESPYDKWVGIEDSKGEEFLISDGKIKSFSFEYLQPNPTKGDMEYIWSDSFIPEEMKPEDTNKEVLSTFPLAIRIRIESVTDDFKLPLIHIPIFEQTVIDPKGNLQR